MSNFLEQLVAEWYEYRGFFVRRDILVGKLGRGGHEGELDVVAFRASDKKLVHIEASMDTLSWAQRETMFAKKFGSGRKHIRSLFNGLDVPTDVEQIAALVYASKKNHKTIGGGKILFIDELLQEIRNDLSTKFVDNAAVPEQYVILRSLQFAANYWH